MNNDKDYTNVILEDINAKFDKIVEIVGQLGDDLKDKASQTSIDNLAADTKIIKAAVVDTSRELQQLERRVIHLEG